jgi:predicted oxidoreductase
LCCNNAIQQKNLTQRRKEYHTSIFFLAPSRLCLKTFYLQPMSIKLSPVIAGCMKWGVWGAKFSTEKYLQMIEECIALGVTTFDHADIYGDYTTEEEFGLALKENSSLRKQIQIITKCGIRRFAVNRPEHQISYYDTSKQHIITSVERSLKNFHTDYIDILLIHRPDPLMHPAEIAEAFEVLKEQGKVLHFGVSNFTVSETAMMHSQFPVEFNQIEISILNMGPIHNGQLDQCLELGIIPMAWSPLGGGNVFDPENDEQIKRVVSAAAIIAEKYSVGPDQILLRWLLMHPSGILPVLGTSKFERVKKALEATEIKMTREEWFILWRASTGHDVP